MDYIVINSPISNIKLFSKNGFLTKILFTNEKISFVNKNSTLTLAKKEIDEYFLGQRKYFTIPLNQETNTFSKKVFKALTNIPYGKTVSYKYIAEQINNPKAYRAVGRANSRNNLPIIIPCHRVITSNGKLGGYSGGEQIKKYLIELENKYNRVGNN